MTLLKDIVQIEKGRKYKLLEEKQEGAIRVFQANDFRNENKPLYTLDADGVLAQEDDIILVWDGSVGQMGIGKSGYVGSTMVKLKVKNKKQFSPFFIYRFLQTKSEYLKRKATGSTIMHINRKSLEQLEVPDLEIDDQLHIANILSKAENLIAQRKESIRLLDEFLKSTFLEMFGDPSTNRKKFTKGKIKDVVTEVKYGTSSPAEDEGLYPYLRMNNITPDGYMDYSKLKYINIVDDKEKEKYVVRKGDLLFNRTNSKELVGKTGVFNEDSEMIIAGYLIRVRTNEKANPWFLWGYLNSIHGKKTLLGMCKSIVGMANINAQELQGIKILIPPIELQTQFARIVEKTESLKTQYQQSLQELEKLYGSLSQKAFRGELSVKQNNSITS
ncbi:MAG: restriction endonuclease subunit S [Bacteroidetes bacterium]|nr:restriction endonuclease subunit S [Bacteroidota bacterium]